MTRFLKFHASISMNVSLNSQVIFIRSMAELKASYFSRGKRNDGHLNMSNTVLINKGDKVWCLGYVQDVDGDNLFVDLDCAKFPPSWIHSSQVWMHRRFVRTKSWHTCGATGYFPVPGECRCQLPHVQVALRDEEDGPYIFRSAGFLGHIGMCNTMYSFGYVRRNTNGAETSQSGQYDIVHRWQLVAALPVDGPPLFATIHKNLLVSKYVIALKKFYWIKSDDERAIRRVINTAYRSLEYSTSRNRGFFARMDNGCITFVILTDENFRIYSSGKTIVAAVEKQLAVCSPNITERFFRAFLDFGDYVPLLTNFTHLFGKKAEEEGSGDLNGEGTIEEPSFGSVLHDILLEIIAHLDVHSQVVARRVCSFWNITLSKNAKWLHACVTFNVQNTLLTCPMPGSHWNWQLAKQDAAYDAAFLLHRIITSDTKALVIVNLNQHLLQFILSIISAVLRFKNVVLPTIILKDYQNFEEMETHDDFSNYHQLRDLPILMTQCRRLLVLNYTINDGVCDCLVRVTPESRLKAYCVIPKVVFNCSSLADSTAVTRCFLMQLEQHLPNVDGCIKDRFRKKHAKWARSLPYPDGWQDFRRLLRMHSATDMADSASFWDDLDLRRFEDLPISKLAWHLISRNGLFI